MKILLLTVLISCLYWTPLRAVELFGIDLADASRDQLRNAVKSAGAKLLREAAGDGFYDVYQSDRLVYDSSHLYLGFVKQDRKFAFAEYELNGLSQPGLLQVLTRKYGIPAVTNGKFFSDRSYSWQSNGITISLQTDWNAYKTRLGYFHTGNLQRLKNERKTFRQKSNNGEQLYLPQAY